MLLSRREGWRRVLCALAAVVLLWFLAAQSPHQVHHVFEPHEIQDECPLAAGADRTYGATVCPGGDAPVELVAAHTPPPVPRRIVDAARAAPLARAPPRLAA